MPKYNIYTKIESNVPAVDLFMISMCIELTPIIKTCAVVSGATTSKPKLSNSVP